MALNSNAVQGSAYTLNRVRSYIPTLWSSEIRRARDVMFIMRDHIKTMDEAANFGDTIKVMTFGRLGVFSKLPETPVTLQANSEGEYSFIIDQYKYCATAIEDIVAIQSKYNLRNECVREISYTLGRDIDNYILGLRAEINATASQVIFNTSTGALGGTPLALNRAAILSALQILQEASVPEDGIRLLVGVGQYNDLLTIPEFTSADFVSGKPTESGVVGRLYGIPVVKSNQVTVNSLTGYVNGTNAIGQPTPGVTGSPYMPTQFTTVPVSLPTSSNSLPVATAMMYHKDWAVFAMQKSPKLETSRENLYQMDAMVSTQVYGGKVYRNDHAVLIHSAP